MANKKNWYEGIENRASNTRFDFNLPTWSNNFNKLTESLFKKPFDLENVNVHITPFNDFMADLEGFGFQDKGNHYEMVTNLGGQKGESGAPEDAVKVELTGKNNRTIEITYEQSTSSDENCFYSHSQKTSVTLPTDADEKTLRAFYDDDGNVVVSVEKKTKDDSGKASRSIPIGRATRD